MERPTVRQAPLRQPPEGPAPAGVGTSYTPLQLHFLGRLRHLVALQKAHSQQANPDPLLVKVLQKSIYSTFIDCLSLGLGEEARLLLREGQTVGRH